jgi:HD-GYP domain-containing protein (c-di-GMP phosphodiesterase class II)
LAILPFRDVSDPDEKRKEILWIAISFIVILASWLAVVLVFGYQPLALGMTYDETVLVTGLGLLVFCSILYLAGREREQRYTNRRLLARLQSTVASLDERIRQLDGLCSASSELTGSLQLDRVAQLVVESLIRNQGANAASLVLLDEGTGRPLYARHAGPEVPDDDAGCAVLEVTWPDLFGHDNDASADLPARIEAQNKLGHIICAPLRFNSTISGLVVARRAETDPHFAADDASLLKTLANMAAKAIESAHLHSALRESYLATVRSLVCSLDARDDYAAAHGHRVSALATRLAEHMGVPESMARDIEAFGALHDVGKIGIPDHILLKEGPLSEDEKAIFQEHCTIGERIIRPLKPSREALALVRSHHERWDGRGYPDGLAGEAIPLLGRIMKVADSYDALISDRPYRRALSEDEALTHFRLNVGTQYDPKVVEALTAVIRDARHGQSEDSHLANSAGPSRQSANTPRLASTA